MYEKCQFCQQVVICCQETLFDLFCFPKTQLKIKTNNRKWKITKKYIFSCQIVCIWIGIHSDEKRKMTPILIQPRDEGTSRIVKGHQQRKEAFMVPWMPCSIMASSIYLGTFEQARNPSVIETLGITHVLSIGR